jgi:hypothetical protein
MAQDTKYALLNEVFHSLVQDGNSRKYALEAVNRLFGQDFALCEDCNNNLADTYEYEGHEWSICNKCESAKPTINDMTREWAESNA